MQAQAAMPGLKPMRLQKPADWSVWLSFIRMITMGDRIWDLVNPDLETKPQHLAEPIEPVFVRGETLDLVAYNIYKADSEIHTKQLKKFQRQQDAFNGLVRHIQSTISAEAAVYLAEEKDPHPYKLLKRLKSRFAPTNTSRKIEIEAKHKELCRGPDNQNLDRWLDDWRLNYSVGKELDVAEFQKERPIRDFIYSVMGVDKAWGSAHVDEIEKTVTDDSLFKLIEKFRTYMKLMDSHKTYSGMHSAFSTDQDQSDQSNKNQSSFRGGRGRGRGGGGSELSFRGKRQPRDCLCGVPHYWYECAYLNPTKRPNNWKADPETAKRVAEGMKDAEMKRRVEAHIKKINEKKKNDQASQQSNDQKNQGDQSNQQNQSSDQSTAFAAENYGAFTTMHSTFSAITYPLQSSWILDNGSDTHLCNHTMAHRFKKTRDAPSGGVFAGEGRSNVEAYGEVDISIPGPDGRIWKVKLIDVCYIPGFMTNIVSARKLRAKGVYFDDQKMRMHVNGHTLGWVKNAYNHDVLEDNTAGDQSAFATSKTSIKSATVDHWHQLLAHPSNDVIQHLDAAAEGVRIINQGTVPKTHECETCALSKMHRIVSRSHEKEENSPTNAPFFRISYDLIAMTTAMNGQKWVSHFACTTHDFNLVYTHKSKDEASAMVRHAINVIRTRYNGKVVFFRSDGEKSLGLEFRDFISEMGITYESSAPDTPAQNGHSEKKGHLLTMKARALRIGAGLPEYLWPWIVQSAGYLMNRTPMKKHGWKTPHEMILGTKPHLGHLRKFGCKAYSLNKNIDKSAKMQARAHLGHLVGYDSTNIFLIWIPSQRKVIRNRDVMFDENATYDEGDIDLQQLVNEPMLETGFDIPNIPTSANIEDLSSDEEEWEIIIPRTIPSNQSKGKEKASEYSNDQGYLPSPSSTPTPAPESEDSSSILTPGENSENSESAKAPPAPISGGKKLKKFAPSAPASKNISSRVDEGNIIPEGVKRTRQPTSRRSAYTSALDRAENGGNEAYHGAFSAYSAANQYYIPDDRLHQNTEKSGPKLHRDNLPPEPQHFGDLRAHAHAEGFKNAMRTEIMTLKSKGTWTEVPYSSVQNISTIPTTWVFKYKFDDQGFLTKYKARLCARGDLQKTDRDTYAATLAARIFRVLMALVCAFDLDTRQYDAINAFVNSEIDEPVYLRPPAGWMEDEGILLLLHRALYGLKQSPALWYRNFSETLIEFGLNQVSGVECLFTNGSMLCFFFVDDIAVLYDRRYTDQVDEFQKKLFARYEMRYIGEIEWFLGIRISRDRHQRLLSLCQDSYIDKLAVKFNIDISQKAPGSPLSEDHVKNTGTATNQEILAYQQRVGSINYAAVITRPDIAYSASKLSEFLTNPSQAHLNAADRVISYLIHTKYLGIQFDARVIDSQSIFLGSSDASYANDPETRYSSQGYGFMLFNGLVDWKASKQKTVTISSTEAELLAISTTGKELIWWTRFFDEISFRLPHTSVIQCDNMQTIRILTNPTAPYTTKLRHVDVHRHWLGQEVRKKNITVKWTPTARILADGFTKTLSSQKHKNFLDLIGLKTCYEGGKD